MDERYYMLGALGLLLVGLLMYFFVALVRYRAAKRRAKALRIAEAEGEAKYLDASAESADDVFAARPTPPTAAATIPGVAPAPLELPVVHTPEPAVHMHLPEVHASDNRIADTAESAVFGEPDFAADQPDEPEVPAQAELAAKVTSAEPALVPEPLPVMSAEPALVPEPLPPVAPLPEPSAPPAPTPPQPELAAEFSAALADAFGEPPEPSSPTPAPPVTAAPAPEPITASLPGYSLADELERLMAAAEAAPLLTAEEHATAIAPPTLAREVEEPFEIPSEPLFPPPSVGQALSTAASAPGAPPVPPVEPIIPTEVPPAGFTPAAMSPVADAPTRFARDDIPEYRMVAPVELQFTSSESRVGVKPGTRSYAEFQRLAGILLQDLRSARGW